MLRLKDKNVPEELLQASKLGVEFQIAKCSFGVLFPPLCVSYNAAVKAGPEALEDWKNNNSFYALQSVEQGEK